MRTDGLPRPADLLGPAGLVAEREIRQRLRGRAFRIATLLVLAAVVAAIVIPAKAHHPARAQRVGIVGSLTGPDRSALRAAARTAGVATTTVRLGSAAAAEDALRRSRVDLAVLGGASVLVRTAPGPGDGSDTARLAAAAARGLGTARALRAARLTPAQASTLARAQPVPVRGLKPASPPSRGRGEAVTAEILVFIMLSQYLSWTLVGVMQEKANRVVEVLLATLRPVQLLAGKVLGIGVVVFAQAALIAAVALAAGRAVGSDAPRGAGPGLVLVQLLWLLLGYAFYSWVYAGAGSLVERQDQVQSLAIPLVVPMVFGYVVAISAAGSGSVSTLLRVLGYLPPTAPFAVPVLAALGAFAWWQVAVSAAVTIGCTVATARLAAAVYQRAILRTGRRVRLRELLPSGDPATPAP